MSEFAKRVAMIVGGGVLTMSASLVVYYEGAMPQSYADPVNIPTICVGHTGPEVKLGQTAGVETCRQLLQKDLGVAWAGVQRCIRVELKDHEAAALTSFTFNVGTTALCSSTLARMANAGNPPARWCPELEKWVYATKAGMKIKLPGLVNRRAAERRMCEGKPWQAANDPLYAAQWSAAA
jgi:lysozyme